MKMVDLNIKHIKFIVSDQRYRRLQWCTIVGHKGLRAEIQICPSVASIRVFLCVQPTVRRVTPQN